QLEVLRMIKKVLVVEDDTDSRKLLEYELQSDGFEVITAEDGLEGLEKAHELKPDIIITDVNMPRLDGIELTEQLREEREFEDVPIVVVSAAGSGDLRQAMAAGASCSMRKPVDLDALITTIHTAVYNPSPGGQDTTG
ncbi:MAG TPA: response regulator, partial [Blastocatellia bacterium]|nr:response regulator [Blastocatellia bacterium]